MHDALTLGVREPPRHLDTDGHRFTQRERTLLQARGERLAPEQLEDEVRAVLALLPRRAA
jgi:hypothetical protein